MAVSKAQQASVNKYVKANYDRINVTMPKGEKEIIQGYATAQGESVNSFIVRAVRERMERDRGVAPEIAQNGPESTAEAEAVSLPSEAVRTAREGTETGKQPVLIDKAKAWENILGIFSDVGTVDFDKARCEHLGIMYLPPDTLETAQQAAERTGETVVDFVARAVVEQQRRDDRSFKMGINPA